MKFISLLILMSLSLSAHAKKTREEFNQINNDFFQFYKESAPKDVLVNLYAKWDINYPAASAGRSTDFKISRYKKPVEWDISVLSGYYREKLGGRNVHLLVLCHELAHHIGGAPYKKDEEGNIRWASMEPQSDYYAAKTCMRNFFNRFPEWFKHEHKTDEGIASLCEKQFFPTSGEIKVCHIIGQAGLQLAWLHQKYDYPPKENEPPVSPETPDPTIATFLDRDSYFTNQCRFDSHLNGALNLPRPKCWYTKEQE